MTSRRPRTAWLVAAVMGCAAPDPAVTGPAPPAPAAPARPDGCQEVAAGGPLQPHVDAAAPGATLCLGPGTHHGPVRVERPVTLWGPPDAVVKSSGEGTTIDVGADGAALLGFRVDGSGGRFDQLDAAVRVRADDVRVEGLRIENAVFGVLLEQSNRATVRGNVVRGDPDSPLGLRGDAIRLWETRDSLVEGNRVADSRDVVVWYSSGNTFRRNLIERGRYGLHLMYSHGNRIESNRLVRDAVGIFVMYSRDVAIDRNLVAESAGASGMGLGVKESGDLTVTRNCFVHDTVGVYLDTSPLYRDDANLFEHNVFRLGDVGVAFHGRAEGNTIRGNSFRDNHAVVRVEGGGDATKARWIGNDYDDYAGYDLDGDGVGDIPYESRRLSASLTARRPELALFRGAPALALVDAASHLVPLYRPRSLLVDAAPRVDPLPLEAACAH